MKKVSLVVSAMVLTSSVFADSLTIDDAFKNGEVEGIIALYGQKKKNKDQDIERNLAYGNGHLGLAYTTDSFYGFNAKVETKGNVKLGEQHKHDWKDNAPFENSALFTQAYLQYELDNVISIKGGRYEGEYEWLSDYQQGAVLEILPIPNTVVAIGYSNKKSESGIDLSEDFYKASEKGVYFVDIQNEGLENIIFNPYFYEMPDFGRFYGLKTIIDTDYFGIIAQYAKSSADEKALDDEDGYIAHIEGTLKIEDFTASLGYIKTSKKGGAVQIATYGDNISPFEDGNYVYDIDARTTYLNLGYSIAGVELGALYGATKYSEDNFKEKELNLSVAYGITDSLTAGVMWVNVDTNNSQDTDYDKYLLAVEYSF